MKKTTKHFISALPIVLALVLVLCLSLIACDHVHNYSEQNNDENYHWNYCPDDNEIDGTSKEAHKDENFDGKCDVCEYEMHVHAYTAQGKDSNKHWNYCPDDNTIDASSESAHADIDVDGYCDVCEYEMGIVTEEVVKIEEIEGVPTLIVKGNLPEFSQDGEPVEIGCIKLHAEGDGNHLYWKNLCTHKWGYEFKVPLSDLAYEKGATPWYWFHFYAYADANPEDNAQYAYKQDLNRGSILTVGDSLQYNGSRYTIKAWTGDNGEIGDGLAIQSEFFYEMSVSEIKIDESNGIELVVKGTVSDNITYLALHANGNDSDEWLGTPVAVNNGAFEARFNIAQLKVDGTPWCWFHIYLSISESLENIDYNAKYNVQRGEMVPDNLSIDKDGIRYSVVNSQSQLVIQPTVIPSFSVSEVSVDTTNGLNLIVKGTLSESQKCLVIRAGGNDSDEWFGTKASINNNSFEAEFDLTQLKLDDTPWCYFHIYTYEVEEPSDYNEGKQQSNLPLGNLNYNDHFDYNGVRYSVIKPNWDGQLVIQPTTIPVSMSISSVNVDETEGLFLVISGTYENVPCIKIHADKGSDNKYWDNLATESGILQYRIDLTQLDSDGGWYWFHIYAYANETPEDNSQYASRQDLNRGSLLSIGQTFENNGIRYTIQAWDGTGDGLAISASPIAE